MLRVSVLGPLEVQRDGRTLVVPRGRTTEVLVRLALDAGRAVPVDRVVDDVWDGEAGTARNTLQSKVSQLRRALGDPGAVTAGPAGYTLHVEPSAVDALAVGGRAADVARARAAGDHEAVEAAASAGLALFRGEVLADAGDGEWLRPHRARLEELRLGLLEERMAARVALGGGSDVVAELRALVEEHPLREGLWSSLVTALYRTGRQAESLATYTRVRTLLADELGVEPGPGLRRLEEQVLRQSPALGGDGGAPLPAPGNLPALASDLVGRGEDLVALTGLLGAHRLVTLTGPAGVGKTRTALEVGRRLTAPGGVWLVRLDAVRDPGDVTRAVAETLAVPATGAALVERLAGAGALLLVDNCEHVADAVADLVTTLLDGAPTLRVLATSQVPLGLEGEVVRPLAPLAPAEAAAMFVDRARRVRSTAVSGDDDASVEDLCRALDGLPLAIELAAARARSLSVGEIARRLDDRFTLLRDPTSRAPERRRALGAAIGWSHDLLFPDEQRGLWALSVFAGGATPAAAEHVLGALDVPAEATLDVLDRLVDRSLVAVDVDPAGGSRLRLLDSIRAFAAGRLADAGLEPAARAAHARWWAEVAARSGARVRGPAQAEVLDVVRAERADVDAALAWCAEHDPPLGLRTAVGFGWAWVVLGDGVAGAARVRAAVAAVATSGDGEADPPLLAEAHLLAGWLEASAGDVALAADDLARAAEGVGGDGCRQADLHRHRAFLRIQQGAPVEVLEEAGAALAGDRGDPARAWESGGSLLLSAYGSVMVGDTAAAAASAREALDLLRAVDDPWALVHAHGILGVVAQADHRLDDAAAAFARAAEESERCGFLGQAALHLTRLGRVLQQRGDLDAAVGTLERAVAAARRDGDLRMAATARTTLARILLARDELVPALALLQQNDAWYSGSGGDGALLTRALLAALTARTEGSGPELATVLDETAAAGDGEARLVVLDALARRSADADDLEEAARLLVLADEQHAAVAHLVDEADRVDAGPARERLGTVASGR